jgi:5-hydroxyisourate hydrolase-like protein (transthyretin family)
MRTTLTRLLAGTAVATAAVLAVAGTASASTPPKAPTALSITIAKGSIFIGQKDTIGGALTSAGTPVPGRIVELERWSPAKNKWYAFEGEKTGSKGRVAFVEAPKTTTLYRLFFAGGPNYKASASAAGLVVVKPFPKTKTVLSIAQTPGTSNPGGSGVKRTYDTISGQLATAKGVDLGGQWVWLAKVVDGKAHLSVEFKTGKLGKVSFKVSPSATTTYELVFRATKALAGSASGTVTDTVS